MSCSACFVDSVDLSPVSLVDRSLTTLAEQAQLILDLLLTSKLPL